MYWDFSILFYILIWLFEFPTTNFDVIFVISRLGLSVSFLGPMEATFSSWILSSELLETHNLRALSLRHEDSCIHYIQRLFLEGSIVRQLYLLFLFFRLKRLVFLDILGLFYCVRYLNWAVWPSRWCYFLDIASVKEFWGPLEATFSSWIRSSGLHCARELRASVLKHKDCCLHQLQTLFVEDNIVRQLDLRFLFIWIAREGSPKLKTFAINVERQRRRNYRRIFAQKVAIRNRPLFF